MQVALGNPMSTPKSGSGVLALSQISKVYSTPVLTDIDLELEEGLVLALTGENGAGKSTLSKIISGLILPTRGTMTYCNAPFSPISRREAESKGIRMVMQELNLLPTLTIAENLFFKRLPTMNGWIRYHQLHEQARYAMARVGLDSLAPDTLVGELGIGHQQMVEIARNLIGECRILILDEPTAMLTGREVECLFEQVEQLKRAGVSIVYISHRLEELARIADRVAVLRDGRIVSIGTMDEHPAHRLVTLMAGRDTEEEFKRKEGKMGATIFRVNNLHRGNRVRDVSFEVKSGEIFGISGLVGSGRTELLRVIFGADAKDSGTISIGNPLRPSTIRSPWDAVKQGIALITEDRKGEGLLLSQSIASNFALGNFDVIAGRGGWVDGKRLEKMSHRQIDAMRIRCTNVHQPVEELSGGNQQKVLIGRWLEKNAQVLLFDEPTRGVDVSAKFDIYGLLAAEANKGKGLIVVSSELRELMLICDRIGVMSAGKLVRIFHRGEWTQDALLAAAFSGYAKREALLATEQSTPRVTI